MTPHMTTHDLLKIAVKNILSHPDAYQWTLQGFGMLRCYLSKEVRLHVWDSRFRNQGVSDVHTHPWHFRSYVVAGHLQNRLYEVYKPADQQSKDDRFMGYHMRQLIQCGAGGGLCGAPERVALYHLRDRLYTEGQCYFEQAQEVHCSLPADGTVTLVTRQFLPDEEHAHVFYPEGEQWGSAEPRKATGLEVMEITRNSLARWFERSVNRQGRSI